MLFALLAIISLCQIFVPEVQECTSKNLWSIWGLFQLLFTFLGPKTFKIVKSTSWCFVHFWPVHFWTSSGASPLWKFSKNSSKSTNSIIPKSQFHSFSIINNSVSVKHMTQKALKTWSCGKSRSDYDRLPNDTRFGLYTSADLYKGNVTPIVRNLEQPNYNLITLHLSHNYIFQPFHIQYCNVINCPIWNK